MADPKTCPDCGKESGAERGQCSVAWSVEHGNARDRACASLNCLRAQLAQRDARIAALEAAGDGLYRATYWLAVTTDRNDCDTHLVAWTKARTA